MPWAKLAGLRPSTRFAIRVAAGSSFARDVDWKLAMCFRLPMTATMPTHLPMVSSLRGVTVQDELLEARLEKNRQQAYAACTKMLAENGLAAVLVDVEHLFDGQGLFFYFLGDVGPELEAYTERLAEAYEAKVQFRKFTDTLIEGCGPGCGTDEAKGQGGCDSCTSCAVASACGTKRA